MLCVVYCMGVLRALCVYSEWHEQVLHMHVLCVVHVLQECVTCSVGCVSVCYKNMCCMFVA